MGLPYAMAGVSKEERTGVRYEAIFLTTSRTEYRWPFGFEANCVVRGIVYWYDVDNWRFDGSQHHWFMKINAGRINCPLSSRAEDCIMKAELYLTLHAYTRIVPSIHLLFCGIDDGYQARFSGSPDIIYHSL